MREIFEIRWHGRGGQGAKTASLLLADAAFSGGMYKDSLSMVLKEWERLLLLTIVSLKIQ